MKIRPFADRVLVKKIPAAKITAGGLHIPDTARERATEAEVIAVGTGKVLPDGTVRPIDVKAGDRVLFTKYGGAELKAIDDELLILREDDILGVIEEPYDRTGA